MSDENDTRSSEAPTICPFTAVGMVCVLPQGHPGDPVFGGHHMVRADLATEIEALRAEHGIMPPEVTAMLERGLKIQPARGCEHCDGKGYHSIDGGFQWCSCTAARPADSRANDAPVVQHFDPPLNGWLRSAPLTDRFAGKKLLYGKHCRGLGCDDFNEQRPSCACPCSACREPRVDNPNVVDDYKAALEEIYKNTSCSETKRRARRALHGAPPGPPPLPWVPGVTGKPAVAEADSDYPTAAVDWREAEVTLTVGQRVATRSGRKGVVSRICALVIHPDGAESEVTEWMPIGPEQNPVEAGPNGPWRCFQCLVTLPSTDDIGAWCSRCRKADGIHRWQRAVDARSVDYPRLIARVKELVSELYYEEEFKCLDGTVSHSVIRGDDGRGAEPGAEELWKLLGLGSCTAKVEGKP